MTSIRHHLSALALMLVLVVCPLAAAWADAPAAPPPDYIDTAPRLGQAPADGRAAVVYSGPAKQKKDNTKSWLYAAGFVCLIAAFYFTTRTQRGSSSERDDDDSNNNTKDVV